MTEQAQFVFQLNGKWISSCSCGVKETSATKDEANKKSDAHKLMHITTFEVKPIAEVVNVSEAMADDYKDSDIEYELSRARTEFFEAHSGLDHTGAGAGDRIKRFHAAWAMLNAVKRKFGFTTVDATKPRVSR